MEEAGLAEIVLGEVVGPKQHFGAGVAIEGDVLAAVSTSRDESEGGAGVGIDGDAGGIDAVRREGVAKVLAKRVVAHAADEADAEPLALEAHGDVRGSSAAGAGEAGHFAEGPIEVERDEVYQQIAGGYGVEHFARFLFRTSSGYLQKYLAISRRAISTARRGLSKLPWTV